MKIKELPENLKEQLNDFGVKHCKNDIEYNLDEIKFIIVGDNPGKMEKSKYFIGPSGEILRKHFLEKFELVDDFDKRCIVFNKTAIHTKQTNDLREERKKIGIDLFDEIQYFYAKEVAQIANIYNIPILIFGKNKILKRFRERLNELINENIQVLEFNHPASRHYFYSEKNSALFNSLKK